MAAQQSAAGTLLIGNGGNTGNLGSGGVTDGGVLAFSRSDTGLSVSSAISGGGTLYQLGSGTTTLTGSNSYSGGTFINRGSLIVGSAASGGTVGSLGLGSIVNSGSLYFNRSDAGLTISSPISGTGKLYQIGGGTLTHLGTNSYTGIQP